MMKLRTPITLTQLAELADVSVSTVSRALAGKAVISEATRTKIAALAKQHDFQINQSARNLRLRRTGAIGVVLPLGHETEQSLSDPFFMSLLGHLADGLTKRSYDLLLIRVVPKDRKWLDRIVDPGRVDGVIIIGQSDQIETIEEVAHRYANLVVWGAATPGRQHLTIGSDNIAGGRMAAQHLLSHGRTKLSFFGNTDVPEFAARFDGFAQEISGAGAAQPTVVPVHLTTEASYSEICAHLESGVTPDGIFAASDVIAMSALRALQESGLRVPQDVSVIGFDDIIVAQYTTPPLTTVRQNLAAGADYLIEQLFHRMSGEEATSVLLPPRLVLRGSA